jgi:hypothetical protein
MRIRIVNLVATVIAVLAGLTVLAGYFGIGGPLQDTRLALVAIVSLLAAWAVLAGALNLLLVHTKKFLNQTPGWFYSLFVLLGFLLVIIANVLAPFLGWGQGAGSAANAWIFTNVVMVGSAALAGLVAFFLVFAAYRVLRTRRTPMTVIFVIATVLALIVLAPWPTVMPNPVLVGGATLRDVLTAIVHVPAVAGARGLLLGIALGAIATGIRVLLGLDRPYGG